MTTKRRPTWFYPAIAFGATLCLGLAAIAAFAVLYFTMLAPTTPPAPVAAVAGPPTAIPTIALPPTFTPTATLLPTETPAATPTGLPTATPALVPLGQINLEPLLIQPGDLPSGYTGAQIRKMLPPMYDGIPATQNQIHQDFAINGQTKGGVAIMLYDTVADSNVAYSFLLDGMNSDLIHSQPVAGVGTRADVVVISLLTGAPIDMGGDLIFVRCTAVVSIRMTVLSRGMESDQLAAYAQRLDQRLAQAVCR